jgi:hypothetical protein
MDESRLHAAEWAAEWRQRKKNRMIVSIVVGILIVAALGYGVNYITTHADRMTFKSEEEMKEFVQGRYAIESSYMDLVIEGDLVTLTYWSYSHYDRSYAERYGYDAEEDSVHTDHIVKWDYKHGVLKTEWMDDLIIDSDGNIHRGKYTVLYKTDRPRPDPIDPSTLNNADGDPDAVVPEETEEAAEERNEDVEKTEEAAAAAAAV